MRGRHKGGGKEEEKGQEKAKGKGRSGKMSLTNAVRAYARTRMAKKRGMRRGVESQKTGEDRAEESEAQEIERKRAKLAEIERKLAVVVMAEKVAQISQKNEADYTTEER